jgi:hypothetical protein
LLLACGQNDGLLGLNNNSTLCHGSDAGRLGGRSVFVARLMPVLRLHLHLLALLL